MLFVLVGAPSMPLGLRRISRWIMVGRGLAAAYASKSRSLVLVAGGLLKSEHRLGRPTLPPAVAPADTEALARMLLRAVSAWGPDRRIGRDRRSSGHRAARCCTPRASRSRLQLDVRFPWIGVRINDSQTNDVSSSSPSSGWGPRNMLWRLPWPTPPPSGSSTRTTLSRSW